MNLRHAADDCGDQLFARCKQRFEGDRFSSDALKILGEFDGDILLWLPENFCHRPAVAYQLDDEGTAQIVVYALVRKQVLNVEHVTGMLPVESSHDFPCVQVGKGDDTDFRKAELIFH